MNTNEIRATLSIATLFSLRMLGLFMILPVFTPYAHQLVGATPFLIGVTLGIYGLTQALFQFPFGLLSDYYPRKLIILCGLLIFILGSFLAAFSHSIYGVMVGRALQGTGAVGSTLIALLTDLLQPKNRAKGMAILGIMIGLSFFISMIIGPILNAMINIHGIFLLTGILGMLAIILLFTFVPTPTRLIPAEKFSFGALKNSQLIILDMGIFSLHLILTASFIVIPLWMTHWTHYLWPLFISIFLTFILLRFVEKYYYVAIVGLIIAEIMLWRTHTGLTLFFLSFNLLEATLPSLISRIAPPETKGSAIGIYSTCQFLGIFCGGLIGGGIYAHYSPETVLLSCAIIGTIWLLLTIIIQFFRRERVWHVV